MALRGRKQHAVLECVPVGQREMDKAPGFFKKALQARAQAAPHPPPPGKGNGVDRGLACSG